MIRVALFAGNRNEAKEFIRTSTYRPNEIRFIETESDLDGLSSDVEIHMFGSYYERGQQYTALSDQLAERIRHGSTESPDVTTSETAAEPVQAAEPSADTSTAEASESPIDDAEPQPGEIGVVKKLPTRRPNHE